MKSEDRPRISGIPFSNFIAPISSRAEHWPNAMLAHVTHDTKRSEDVRARLDVLSEMPAPGRRR